MQMVPVSSASFFKIMLDPSSHHLQLPPAFVSRHLKNKIPKNPKLKCKNGGFSWNLKVKQIDGVYCFADGWNNVVKDLKLSYGDFLVFRLVGRSTFNVWIYSPNGCEKEFYSEVKVEHAVDVDDVDGHQEEDDDDLVHENENDADENDKDDDDDAYEDEDGGEEEEEDDDDDDGDGDDVEMGSEEDEGDESGSDSDNEEIDGMSIDSRGTERIRGQKRKFAEFDGQLDAANQSLRALKRLAGSNLESNDASDATDGILSNEDFQRIKELKAKKEAKLALAQHGLLKKTSDPKSTVFKVPTSDQLSLKRVDGYTLEANIRKKMTKEERKALIKAGREETGKYQARAAIKQKKTGGLSNRQKEHKKAMPLAAKRSKVERSRRLKKMKQKTAGKQFRGRKAWK